MNFFRIMFAVAAVAVSAEAGADSWMPATESTTVSADGSARVLVVPRGIENPLRYFQGLVEGDPAPGQRAGAASHAFAVMERKRPDGTWTVLWTKPLVNDVAPVDVFVGSEGRFLVTFDNWHSVGYGDDAVVLYDAAGEMTAKFALETLVGKVWFDAFPRSVSSLQWRGEPRASADGRRLVVPVLVPRPDGDAEGSESDEPVVEFVDLEIDPETATSRFPSVADHARATAIVAATSEAQERARHEYEAWWRSPLHAPDDAEESAWHGYLREAFFRLDDQWREAFPASKILRDPHADDYAASLRWLREAIEEYDGHIDVVAIGSLDEANLVAVLVPLLQSIPAGSQRGRRYYVVVGAEHREAVAEAVERTGAAFRWVDPAKGIPQRAERLAESGAE